MLPCANVVNPDCSTTTWIYSGGRSVATIEVVKLGKVISDECTDGSQLDECKRAQRLSVCCSCSLYITNVTSEDAGHYACQQYQREGGHKIAHDAAVHLSVHQGRFALVCNLYVTVCIPSYNSYIYIVSIVKIITMTNIYCLITQAMKLNFPPTRNPQRQ